MYGGGPALPARRGPDGDDENGGMLKIGVSFSGLVGLSVSVHQEWEEL